MTPEELIKRCVCRDLSAWDLFLKRYKGLVGKSVRYKLSRLGARLTSGELEDIIQEVFLSIWEKESLSGLRDAGSLDGWLVLLSINSTANYCRARSIRQNGDNLSLDEAFAPEGEGGLTLNDILPSPVLGTERTVESNELSAIIKNSMAALGVKERLALKLNIYDGKRQREVAEIMRVPEGTAATLIRRGKEKLRKELKEALKR